MLGERGLFLLPEYPDLALLSIFQEKKFLALPIRINLICTSLHRVCLLILDISVVSLWFSGGRTPNTFKLAASPRWFQIMFADRFKKHVRQAT